MNARTGRATTTIALSDAIAMMTSRDEPRARRGLALLTRHLASRGQTWRDAAGRLPAPMRTGRLEATIGLMGHANDNQAYVALAVANRSVGPAHWHALLTTARPHDPRHDHRAHDRQASEAQREQARREADQAQRDAARREAERRAEEAARAARPWDQGGPNSEWDRVASTFASGPESRVQACMAANAKAMRWADWMTDSEKATMARLARIQAGEEIDTGYHWHTPWAYAYRLAQLSPAHLETERLYRAYAYVRGARHSAEKRDPATRWTTRYPKPSGPSGTCRTADGETLNFIRGKVAIDLVDERDGRQTVHFRLTRRGRTIARFTTDHAEFAPMARYFAHIGQTLVVMTRDDIDTPYASVEFIGPWGS